MLMMAQPLIGNYLMIATSSSYSTGSYHNQICCWQQVAQQSACWWTIVSPAALWRLSELTRWPRFSLVQLSLSLRYWHFWTCCGHAGDLGELFVSTALLSISQRLHRSLLCPYSCCWRNERSATASRFHRLMRERKRALIAGIVQIVCKFTIRAFRGIAKEIVGWAVCWCYDMIVKVMFGLRGWSVSGYCNSLFISLPMGACRWSRSWRGSIDGCRWTNSRRGRRSWSLHGILLVLVHDVLLAASGIT